MYVVQLDERSLFRSRGADLDHEELDDLIKYAERDLVDCGDRISDIIDVLDHSVKRYRKEIFFIFRVKAFQPKNDKAVGSAKMVAAMMCQHVPTRANTGHAHGYQIDTLCGDHRGGGTLAIMLAEKEARARGLKSLTLYSTGANVNGFYRKSGFQNLYNSEQILNSNYTHVRLLNNNIGTQRTTYETKRLQNFQRLQKVDMWHIPPFPTPRRMTAAKIIGRKMLATWRDPRTEYGQKRMRR